MASQSMVQLESFLPPEVHRKNRERKLLFYKIREPKINRPRAAAAVRKNEQLAHTTHGCNTWWMPQQQQ